MADLKDKLPDNVPGKFYVDRECIDCDVCRDTSPANFRRNDDNGYSYVYKQPANDEETALCEEALDACPVEAIGDDGADKALAHSYPPPSSDSFRQDYCPCFSWRSVPSVASLYLTRRTLNFTELTATVC